MATTVTTIETITCDVCGCEVEHSTRASESTPTAFITIEYDVWYGGHMFYRDFCQDCNADLVSYFKKKRNGQPAKEGK